MKLTGELLRQLVVNEGRSFSDTARITGNTVAAVSQAAKRHGIVSQHLAKAAPKPLPVVEIYNFYMTERKSLDWLHKRYNRPVAIIKKQLKKAYPDIVFRTMDQAKRPDVLNKPDQLDELARSELTARQIATQLGVKEATVVAAYNRLNTRRHKIDRSAVIIPKQELYHLYWEKRFSTVPIAKQYGTTPWRVTELLRQYGYAVRGKGGARISSHEELRGSEWLGEQYDELGRSMADIARELGTSVRNVAHFLAKYGYESRSKEEVYDKLLSHGKKTVHISPRHGTFECDSLLELAFLEQHESADRLVRPPRMSWNGILFYPDFEIDGVLVEVKSPSESNTPGVNRRRLMKQFWVAAKNGKNLVVWNGRHRDLAPDNADIYYCQDWRLVFDGPGECFNWLSAYGFNGVEYPRSTLLKGLDRLYDITATNKDQLNANLPAVQTIDLLKHFSQHYYRSYRTGYNSISAAWSDGNRSVLREAVRRLWECGGENLNLYGLVRTIGTFFRDFSPVSVFKPWVAGHIYDHLLPNGGTVVDPCIGWGGRLLGCVGRNLVYNGLDLNPLAVSANRELRKFLGCRVGGTSFVEADSETCELPSGDLLFTSPPYPDQEHYHGLVGGQKTDAILRNVFRQFPGVVALNVPTVYAPRATAFAEEAGWRLSERLEMATSSFMGRERTSEPILVFKRHRT